MRNPTKEEQKEFDNILENGLDINFRDDNFSHEGDEFDIECSIKNRVLKINTLFCDDLVCPFTADDLEKLTISLNNCNTLGPSKVVERRREIVSKNRHHENRIK